MTPAAQLARALSVESLGDGRYCVPCGGSCGGDSGHHVVTLGDAGATCDCPGHAFRSGCRHADAVTAYLRLAPLVVPVAAGPGLADVDVPPPMDLEPIDVAPPASSDNGRAAPASRFHLYTAAELLELPPPRWLLDHHIPDGSLAVLYGPPGVGKSFLALAWALSIAAHTPWLRWVTRWGPVLYVAAEGGAGLVQRVQVYRDAHEITRHPDKARFVRESVNLLADTDVDALLASWVGLELGFKPALVVIDTLSRCMPGGDENSAQDVGRVIAASDRIRKATDAAVLLVHHTGKDGLSERGSSALRGAADVMFSLKGEDNVLTLECTKQKDALPIDAYRLRLTPIAGSCVIAPLEGDPTPKTLTGNGWKALRALFDGFQGGESTVGVWQRVSAIPEPSFYRTLKQLLSLGYVTKRGARYVVSVAGEAALKGTLDLLSPDSHESGPATLSHSGGPSKAPGESAGTL